MFENVLGNYVDREGSCTIYISQTNKCFSNQQLFFESEDIFHIRTIFRMNKSFTNLGTFQIE